MVNYCTAANFFCTILAALISVDYSAFFGSTSTFCALHELASVTIRAG